MHAGTSAPTGVCKRYFFSLETSISTYKLGAVHVSETYISQDLLIAVWRRVAPKIILSELGPEAGHVSLLKVNLDLVNASSKFNVGTF